VGNVVGYEIQYDSRPYVLDDEWGFPTEIPVKEARYTLQMPTGWEYKAVWLNHAKVEPNAGAGNQWQWVVTDIPEIRREHRMPPWLASLPAWSWLFSRQVQDRRTVFSPGTTWPKWQTGLASGKRDATPEISSKVAEITAGRTTSQLKMEEIAQFIQKDIRYVAIEIRNWRLAATLGQRRFVHRYGDCKDKATLMSSMLKLMGIDSYYLFINTRRGAIGPETPPEANVRSCNPGDQDA
jgi:transglutaminase-like putative cysteine protease